MSALDSADELAVACSRIADAVHGACAGCGCSHCIAAPRRAARALAENEQWRLSMLVTERGAYLDDRKIAASVVRRLAFDRITDLPLN